MSRPLQLGETAPAAVREHSQQLGARIRLARKRRGLTLRALAARAGVAYDTARAVEAGALQTGLGAYYLVIWALGLESELASFMNPDRDAEGRLRELARTPQRVRAPREDRDDDF